MSLSLEFLINNRASDGALLSFPRDMTRFYILRAAAPLVKLNHQFPHCLQSG